MKLLITLKKITTASNAVYALAAFTTGVSMWRTYVGIELKFDVVSAIVGSLVIGVVLYAALHTLFNHRHTGVKAGALILFVTFFIASGETIRIGAEYKANQEANSASALLRNDNLEVLKLSAAKDEAFKSGLRSQIASLEAANAADRAEANQLKDDIRRQISELVKANASDKVQVERYQALVKRHNQPKTNSANARNAIAEIDKRLVKIDRLTARIEKAGHPFDKKIQVRDTQMNGLRNKLNSQSHTTESSALVTNEPLATDLSNRFHSYLYDLSTAVLMLFACWYREEEPSEVVEVACELDEDFDNTVLMSPVMSDDDTAVFNTAQHHVDASLVQRTCSVATEQVQRTDTKSEPKKEATSPVLISKSELKSQLENRAIKPNDKGAISAPLVISLCSEINNPRQAKKFFEECTKEYLLQGKENGKSGVIYIYPASVKGQISLLQGGLA